MKLLTLIVLALSAAPAPAPARFRAVPIVVDASTPLAAYQLELRDRGGAAQIVGIEGGEAPFDAPPYYDPAALAGGRVILAAFSTERTLPPGRHRVAVVHVREQGEVAYEVVITAAANASGERIAAAAFVEARP